MLWAALSNATVHAQPLASDAFDYSDQKFFAAPGGHGFAAQSPWKSSARKTAKLTDGLRYTLVKRELGGGRAVEIRGHDDRDNPLRRQLAQGFTGDELFVRFLLRYNAATLDQANAKDEEDEGEFFVMWLDDIDGSDGATHNTNTPNIGLHVAPSGKNKGKNLFMVRIGSNRQMFTNVEVEGDRTYLIVGRLAKSTRGPRNEYDSFSIWVDPQPDAKGTPLAVSKSSRGINLVRWIGFATGLKTEKTDRIVIDQLALGSTWESVLGLQEVEPTSPEPPAQPAEIDFARDVFPILQRNCFECHRGADAESGVRLDVREEVLGHSSGSPAIVPGDSRKSRMMELVAADANERMPPEGDPLSAAEVKILAAWIDQGMAWDESLLPSPEVRSDHWAFQPIKRPPVPTVKNMKWVRNPIDAFLSAGHQRAELQPAAEASRTKLLRRLAFDLTGLPPTPQAVDQFSAQKNEDAYEQAVEQLLGSPQYGERWGRHWLDVARWAESNGYQHNNVRQQSWRYRDYVVRSFNQDKPFDQFVREQIAGDQLQPYADEQFIATGFLAAARVSGNEMNPAIRRNDVLVDIVNATAGSLLGLTMQCAQCHNHKFDPLTARDYYRFQAFFAKGQLGNYALLNQTNEKAERSQTFGFYAPSFASANLQRFPIEKIRYPLPYKPSDLANERTYLLVRGDVESRGPVVDPGWPAVFGHVPDQQQVNQRPRLALANWLVARDNPLTARVWVNRIWHYHFGRGLVEHTDDFGLRTESPLHRDLLDWLAVELIESGWRTKHIHRLIVGSSTYRQSSQYDAGAAKIDSDNAYYWRWSPRRLEAEAIRDATLAVSGELDLTVGGRSISTDAKGGQTRRTLYLLQRRQKLPEVQQLFDGASGVVSCGRRRVSTVPLQPLYLLNGEFTFARAKAFAQRVKQEAGESDEHLATHAFRLALGRKPDDEEAAKLIEFMNNAAIPEGEAKAETPLVHLCHALLNLNEFVYID